ncbi:TPA: hypothetical protein EYP26_02315, partial [Candidatus Bathyarchaeota archaeon]|nr:hypothetical protein [Candidatus Bathyarchaeota archaeon]
MEVALILAWLSIAIPAFAYKGREGLLITMALASLWAILSKKIGKSLPKLLLILLLISLLSTINLKPAYPYAIFEYGLPSVGPYGLEPRPLNIVIANETRIFFTEQLSGRIGMVSLSSPLEITEFSLPSHLIYGLSEPWDLDNYTIGSTDYIFFTDYHLNRIWRLDPSATSNNLYYWEIPSGSGPKGIFVFNETTIWFTEFLADKIGKLKVSNNLGSPTSSIVYEYPLPEGSEPLDIIVVGRNVWFTEYGRDRIGCLNMDTGVLMEYSLPLGSKPWGIAADRDGMIWFTLSGRNGIAQLNPWTGKVIEHLGIPTNNSEPRGIAVDNCTGNVWFAEFSGHKIAKYVPGENMFYEYPTLTSSSSPHGIAVWHRGGCNSATAEVWFTEWSGNKIGKIWDYGPQEEFGTTTTKIVTKLTSAISQSSSAGTSAVAYTTETPEIQTDVTVAQITQPEIASTATTLSDTAYRLSTSTMATSTSYIMNVIHTTVTSTYVSTNYVSTTYLTQSTTITSYSTSYTATTSATQTVFTYKTLYTSTMTLTSSTTLTVPYTLRTTIWFTKYRRTTSATTSTTSTSTATLTSTQTTHVTSTITMTTTNTTTVAFTLPTNVTCFIASAAYGSGLSKPVQFLRGFRDNLVLKTSAGSAFMEVFNAWYYSFSPSLAKLIAGSLSLRLLARAFVSPLIGILTLASAAHSLAAPNQEAAVVLAGLVASGLIGAVYFAPAASLACLALRRKIARAKRRILL